MTKKIYEKQMHILIDYYKDACCSLDFTSPFMLTIALILAAQCTDERVNKTTPILFKKYPDIESMAKADITDIENIVKSCGFYRNKAKNIHLCSNVLYENFNSIVPDTMEKLLMLPGIGRKSANVILQECFNKVEGIVVDTHVTRIAKKLGLTNSTNPVIIEKDIMKKIDKRYWRDINHVLVFHGRAICNARKPNCDICPINNLCKQAELNIIKEEVI